VTQQFQTEFKYVFCDRSGFQRGLMEKPEINNLVIVSV
jgi:hypothetical protein